MLNAIKLALLAAVILPVMGCSSPRGKTPQQKRAYAEEMHDKTLREFYETTSQGRELVESSKGYAVFSNANFSLMFLGSGNGYGVTVDRRNNERTYMRMYELSAGIGMGYRDFRAIFLFFDEDLLDEFIANGWQVDADAAAAAQLNSTGGSVDAAAVINRPVVIIEMTDNGLMLRADIAGIKYLPYDELNTADDE